MSPDGHRFLISQPADTVPNLGTAPTRGMLADGLILAVDTRGAPGQVVGTAETELIGSYAVGRISKAFRPRIR